MLNIKTNLSEFIAKVLEEHKKMIERATLRGINNTVFDTKKMLTFEMISVFDRPKPWTLKGVEVVKATPDKQYAIVRLREEAGKGIPAVKYLWSEVFGGQRSLKSYEKKLNERGILPDGYYTVPGKGIALDQYGNVSQGKIVQILSQLGAAERGSGYLMNETPESKKRAKKRAEIFAINKPNGNMPMGVYAYQSGHIMLLLYFIKGAPNYKKRYDFIEKGTAFANEIMPRQMERALDYETKIKL